MGRPKKEVPKAHRSRPPATTPEGRENQLIALAVDLAEKQLQQGTASSQVITHYLKLGTTREKLENDLLKAKTKAIESQEKVEKLYAEALSAMKSYQGQEDLETYEE